MPSISIHYAFLLLAAASMASAQSTALNIIPTSGSGTFPTCAGQCTVLVDAQAQCEPPTAAQGSNTQYENCFCQNPALAPLYTTPDAICTVECPDQSDRAELQTWFQQFCQKVGQGIDPLVTAQSTTLVTLTTTSSPPATSTSSTPAVTITGSGSSQNAAPPSNQSWIDGHWRWVMMIAILIVGFGFLIWFALWLKRRHNRKIEERRAAVSGFPSPSEKRDGARSATPELWGPHQHMHASKGWEYNVSAGTIEDSSSARAEKRERRRSRRERRSRNDMAEMEGRPALLAARQASMKGKGRDTEVSTSEVDARSPSAKGSRSRSRRRPDRDREKQQDRTVEKSLRGLPNNDDEITPTPSQ